MTIKDHLSILKISDLDIVSTCSPHHSLVFLTDNVEGMKINGTLYSDISNSILFLSPKHSWKIVQKCNRSPSGYVMHLSRHILNEPALKKRKINTIRILHSDVVHRTELSPAIECQVHSLMEMIDELLNTDLHHREEAIVSLLNALFIYCENLYQVEGNFHPQDHKNILVYRFINLISDKYNTWHRVNQYAKALHISPKYLNECVQKTLQISAKSLIVEQLIIRTRHKLKLPDKSVKEVAFELGFSSPAYFSAFCRKHLGCPPIAYKKRKLKKSKVLLPLS